MLSTCSSSSASESAANSVPVSARPSIPSCPAIAAGRRRGRRDHAGANSCLPAARDRVLCFLAGRIDDGDERQQRRTLHLLQQWTVARVERARVDVARATGGRAALAGETIVLGEDRSRPGRSARNRSKPSTSRICDERASGTSGAPLTRRRTLSALVLHLVEGRHQLVVGVERHLTHARVEAPRLVDVDPPFAASTTSAASVGSPTISPSRTAASFASAIGTGTARARCPSPRDPKDLAVGRVTLALDRIAPACDHELPCGHLVERQRAGLVRANGRRRAERLHRAQPLHDRTLGRERLRSQREHGRDDRGSPVGIAATARLIPIRKRSSKSSPRISLEARRAPARRPP